MKRLILLSGLFLFSSISAIAQETCYSVQNGDFNTITNWNQARAGDGDACPDFAGNTFIVQDGHTMSTSAALSDLNGVTIETGAVMEKNHAVASSSATIDNGGRLIQAGGAMGTFGGTTRNFDDESIIEYATSTGFSPAINYGHLVISGSGTFNPGNTSMTIRGDFTITSGTFRGTSSGNPTHTIGGSIFIEGGLLELTFDTGNPVFEISGDVIQTGGSVRAASSGATGRGTFRFVGNGNSTLTLTSVSDVHPDQFNLSVQKATSAQYVKLGAPFNVGVGRTLTLGTGYIDATEHLLLISHDASVIGADEESYVEGEISQFVSGATETPTAFDLFYPFGAEGQYRPFELHVTVTHTSTVTFVSTMVNEEPPAGITIRENEGIGAVSDTRYWGASYFSVGTVDVSEVAVTLHYGPDDDVFDPTMARVVMEDNNEWVNKGGTGTGAGSGQITSTEPINDLTIFPAYTLFAIGEFDAQLPVQIVSFDAVRNGRAIFLQWTTGSEQNNRGFEIQSQRGELFETIAFVEGAGTSIEPRDYAYEVQDAQIGRNAFRLKQVDLDGRYAFSPVIEVEVELAERFTLSGAYPNPFNPATRFELTIAREQHVDIALYDLEGRRVGALFSGTLPANETRVFTVSGADLSSGVYLIRVSGADFSATRTITLLK